MPISIFQSQSGSHYSFDSDFKHLTQISNLNLVSPGSRVFNRYSKSVQNLIHQSLFQMVPSIFDFFNLMILLKLCVTNIFCQDNKKLSHNYPLFFFSGCALNPVISNNALQLPGCQSIYFRGKSNHSCHSSKNELSQERNSNANFFENAQTPFSCSTEAGH